MTPRRSPTSKDYLCTFICVLLLPESRHFCTPRRLRLGTRRGPDAGGASERNPPKKYPRTFYHSNSACHPYLRLFSSYCLPHAVILICGYDIHRGKKQTQKNKNTKQRGSHIMKCLPWEESRGCVCSRQMGRQDRRGSCQRL